MRYLFHRRGHARFQLRVSALKMTCYLRQQHRSKSLCSTFIGHSFSCPLFVPRPDSHSFHLVPRSKNAWSYTSTPQYVFMAWCLVKHRDNFTFTFTFLPLTWIQKNWHKIKLWVQCAFTSSISRTYSGIIMKSCYFWTKWYYGSLPSVTVLTTNRNKLFL